MKKILLLAAIIACGYANAQENVTEAPASEGFKKGDVILTGAVAFSGTKTGEIKGSSFSVMPSAGYFLTNNIAVGVSLGYGHSEEDVYIGLDSPYPQMANQVANTFSADVYGRYYFTAAKKFSLFAQLSAGFATSKREFEGTNIEFKTNSFGAAIAPGISYFLTSHLALEASFGIINYTTYNPENIDIYGYGADEDTTNNFNIGLNLSNIYFGLVYKF